MTEVLGFALAGRANLGTQNSGRFIELSILGRTEWNWWVSGVVEGYPFPCAHSPYSPTNKILGKKATLVYRSPYYCE